MIDLEDQVLSEKTDRSIKNPNQQNSLRIWQSLRSIIFFIILLYFIPQIEAWIGVDNIRNFINAAGIFAPILFIVVRIITVVIPPLRLGPLSTILHRAFGFWPSVIYAVVVVVVGSSINFLIGRRWGSKIVGFFFGPDILHIVDSYAEKYFGKNLFTTFLLLLSNYELMSYAGGLTKVKFSELIWAAIFSSLITSPLLVIRDLSIGNNDLLATGLFILGYLLSILPLLYVGRKDISLWWKQEMDKIHKS